MRRLDRLERALAAEAADVDDRLLLLAVQPAQLSLLESGGELCRRVRYATDDERDAARRASWRQAKRRHRARRREQAT